MPFTLYLFLSYISPIYPSPLVHWLCHTFVVYQQDSPLIRAKASPLPLSLIPLFWALSPPLGIPLHWLGYGLQPCGLQPSNLRLPLAALTCLRFVQPLIQHKSSIDLPHLPSRTFPAGLPASFPQTSRSRISALRLRPSEPTSDYFRSTVRSPTSPSFSRTTPSYDPPSRSASI